MSLNFAPKILTTYKQYTLGSQLVTPGEYRQLWRVTVADHSLGSRTYYRFRPSEVRQNEGGWSFISVRLNHKDIDRLTIKCQRLAGALQSGAPSQCLGLPVPAPAAILNPLSVLSLTLTLD